VEVAGAAGTGERDGIITGMFIDQAEIEVKSGQGGWRCIIA
jgi:hypothetical protein